MSNKKVWGTRIGLSCLLILAIAFSFERDRHSTNALLASGIKLEDSVKLEDKANDKDIDAADLKLFREEIEPVLKETCQKCHGEKKQESNLRLDSRDALIKGGKNGPTIVPGKPDESLLLKVLDYNGDIQMPPDEKLDEETRAAFKKWIEKSAPWPKAKAKT